MGRILVIGASGLVSSEVVRILKSQGHTIRATTSKAPGVRDGVEYVHANVLTGEGLASAFEGVERAFLMNPGGHAKQYDAFHALFEQAKRQKLKKVVMMSAMGVEFAPESPMGRAEAELAQSGLNYNIIRPNWFMQNFHTFWIHGIKTEGKILLPAAQAKVSFIDTRDISAVAAKLVTDDSVPVGAYNLTGPEAIDHNQVAKAISEVTGKKVVYQEITPDALRQGLLGAGVDKDYVEFLLVIMGALAAGYNAPVTDNVEKFLGRKPIDIQKYTRDNKQALQ
jgi:uncharacterized protein YbjT (DUF2867 family)